MYQACSGGGMKILEEILFFKKRNAKNMIKNKTRTPKKLRSKKRLGCVKSTTNSIPQK